jgi:hypothetical protein
LLNIGSPTNYAAMITVWNLGQALSMVVMIAGISSSIGSRMVPQK